MVAQKMFDGRPKTVQLDRRGNAWEFRMVLKEDIEHDKEFIDSVRSLSLQLAEVFHTNPVDIHLCDEYLNTIHVVVAGPIRTASREKDSLVQ